MRKARREVFDPHEVNVVHVYSRTVRRCFLFGQDTLTGKNFDHRKDWIEERLEQLAGLFGIDLLAYAVMSNHYHLVLRNRPDVVASWDDTEVARRWLTLCPGKRCPNRKSDQPSSKELDTIRKCPVQLAKVRDRLADVSWWMRLLNQHIASRCNREDEASGRFFEERFKMTRLLDEASVLACAAYVDLNPIRAAMAETIEQSDHTSVQRRIEAMHQSTDPAANESDAPSIPIEPIRHRSDAMLSPIRIDEVSDPTGPAVSDDAARCSDKGFLPMSPAVYLELLDWTARQPKSGKRGATPTSMPPVLQRLNLSVESWLELVNQFGRLFSHVAGHPRRIDGLRSHHRHRRFYVRPRVRELMPTTE